MDVAAPFADGVLGNPNGSPSPLKVRLAALAIVEVANPVIVLFVNVSVVETPTILILLPAALSIAHLVSLWSNTNCALVPPLLPTLNPLSCEPKAVEPVKFKSRIGSSTVKVAVFTIEDEPSTTKSP